MSSSFGSLLHLFRGEQGKSFNMLAGYQKFGLLVLSSFLLVIATEAYSDVDLRIAERKAIPHYIRHSYEYPDIDIKKIMQQRGITVKPYQPSNISRGTYNHQGSNAVNNRNRNWRPQYNKLQAQSNHLEPRPNWYYSKKNQRNSKNLRNHHYGKSKVKSRFA